jgi:hypothetical protein
MLAQCDVVGCKQSERSPIDPEQRHTFCLSLCLLVRAPFLPIQTESQFRKTDATRLKPVPLRTNQARSASVAQRCRSRHAATSIGPAKTRCYSTDNRFRRSHL